jgi:hypothetical protein
MKLIRSVEELPPVGTEAPSAFWSAVTSDHIKALALMYIIEELNGDSTEQLTDEQCRAILSRCQAHVLYLLPETLV